MMNHCARRALQIASGLTLAGALHAQEPSPEVVAASPPAVQAAVNGAPPAPAKPRARDAVLSLAVALDPVTLAPEAKVDPELEADCKFEEIVGIDVTKMLRHYHLGGTKPTGAGPRVLRLAVTDVSGSSGGIYTGTKSIRVHATLLVDGKVDRETDLYRYNTGGNPFRGTCHIFRQHTKRLGKDVAARIKDARYKVDDQMAGDKDDVE